MNKSEIVEKTVEHVRNIMSGESSGHDWWHAYRVWKLAKFISERENVDSFIPEIAALLHDIADWKFHDEGEGSRISRKWLESIGVDNEIIHHVCDIIDSTSFKGANVKFEMGTIEGKIVQDADRLDALGAIGIARTFAYGGHKNRMIYDPDVKPVMHNSKEEYRNSTGPTVNHFYEKLLLIKDRMNTETAKKMAEGRHAFMEQFLDEFFKEWDMQS